MTVHLLRPGTALHARELVRGVRCPVDPVCETGAGCAPPSSSGEPVAESAAVSEAELTRRLTLPRGLTNLLIAVRCLRANLSRSRTRNYFLCSCSYRLYPWLRRTGWCALLAGRMAPLLTNVLERDARASDAVTAQVGVPFPSDYWSHYV